MNFVVFVVAGFVVLMPQSSLGGPSRLRRPRVERFYSIESTAADGRNLLARKLEFDERLLQDGSMSTDLTHSPSHTPTFSPTAVTGATSPPVRDVTSSPTDTTSSFPTQHPSQLPSEPPSSSPTEKAVERKEWREIGRIQPLSEGLVGMDVSISADGSTLAIGIPGDSPGVIGVYRFDEANRQWVSFGDIFDFGGEGGVRFGTAVAMSSDGLTVAGASGYSRSIPDPSDGLSNVLAGRAQVTVYEDGAWKLKGQVLVGTECRSLGWSTDLSGSGNRWVVATPDVAGSGDFRCNAVDFGPQRGRIQVFDFDGAEWIQTGGDILGSLPESQLGQSVSISRDGTRVAAYSQGNIGRLDPYFRVYEQGSDGQWVQLGQDLFVEASGATTSINNLDLSADGSRFVITSKRIDTGTGYFQVFEWQRSTESWVQVGSDVDDLDACCALFTFDTSVSISDDGNRVVYGNTGFDSFRGKVAVFDFVNDAWQEIGSSVLGLVSQSDEVWFGYSSAASTSGDRIAIGAPFASLNYVSVYDLSNV